MQKPNKFYRKYTNIFNLCKKQELISPQQTTFKNDL